MYAIKCSKCEVFTSISEFSTSIKGINKGQISKVCNKCKDVRKLTAESKKIMPNPDNYKPDYRCFRCSKLVFESQMHHYKSGKLTKSCVDCMNL